MQANSAAQGVLSSQGQLQPSWSPPPLAAFTPPAQSLCLERQTDLGQANLGSLSMRDQGRDLAGQSLVGLIGEPVTGLQQWMEQEVWKDELGPDWTMDLQGTGKEGGALSQAQAATVKTRGLRLSQRYV